MNNKKYKLSKYGTLTINDKAKLIRWIDNNRQEVVFDYLLDKKNTFKQFVAKSINWLCDRYLFNNK